MCVYRLMQEIQLDKHIKLLDCPGIVMAESSSGDPSVSLRNCIKVSPYCQRLLWNCGIYQNSEEQNLFYEEKKLCPFPRPHWHYQWPCKCVYPKPIHIQGSMLLTVTLIVNMFNDTFTCNVLLIGYATGCNVLPRLSIIKMHIDLLMDMIIIVVYSSNSFV